ncbi:MAG: NAD(+) synthase [Candidatus Freyrarchaeum guaymaensis]
MKSLTVELLELDYEQISEKIEDFIRSSVKSFERNGAIIGLSGGLDSSVVATLSVRALGRDKVFGLIMPERDSETRNIKDAERLAKKLKIDYEVLDITPILRKIGIYEILPDSIVKNRKLFEEKLKDAVRVSVFEAKSVDLPLIDTMSDRGDYSFTFKPKARDLPVTDIKAGRRGYCFTFPKVRVRSIMLYFHACLRRLLVTGTLNKSEYLTSTYDEYGDGACDIAPLRNLYKTQVRQLAKYLKIPKNILKKPSSPDLIAGSIVTDEVLLGIKYETLDSILFLLEKGMENSEIARRLGVDEDTVKKVEKTVAMANVRREMPFAAPI